jgi:hypothetical protein
VANIIHDIFLIIYSLFFNLDYLTDTAITLSLEHTSGTPRELGGVKERVKGKG